MTAALYVAGALVLLGTLTLLHELGHFYVARSRGIRPRALSIGFGPAVWRTEHDGIRYQVGILPLGGFVLFDDGEAVADDKTRFMNASLGTQALVMCAGIIVQAVLAFALAGAVYGLWGMPGGAQARVVSVLTSSPASRAGMRAGDQILRVGPIAMQKGGSLTALEHLLSYDDHHRIPAHFVYRTPRGAVQSATLRPDANRQVGLTIGTVPVLSRNAPLLTREVDAYSVIGRTMLAEFGALYHLVTGQLAVSALSGPVSIVGMTSQVLSLGVPQGLIWAAVLAINLAIMNALPFPGLDGGQLAMLVVAAFRKGRRNLRVESAVQAAGLIVVVMFTAYITVVNLVR